MSDGILVIDDVMEGNTPAQREAVKRWFESDDFARATVAFGETNRQPSGPPKPLPGFERYAHVGSYKRPNRHLAEVAKVKKPLDAFNDTLPPGKTLHPTKGYRNRAAASVERDMATAEAKRDLSAWYRLWHPNFKVAA